MQVYEAEIRSLYTHLALSGFHLSCNQHQPASFNACTSREHDILSTQTWMSPNRGTANCWLHGGRLLHGNNKKQISTCTCTYWWCERSYNVSQLSDTQFPSRWIRCSHGWAQSSSLAFIYAQDFRDCLSLPRLNTLIWWNQISRSKRVSEDTGKATTDHVMLAETHILTQRRKSSVIPNALVIEIVTDSWRRSRIIMWVLDRRLDRKPSTHAIGITPWGCQGW
jgi:hypothetical protein